VKESGGLECLLEAAPGPWPPGWLLAAGCWPLAAWRALTNSLEGQPVAIKRQRTASWRHSPKRLRNLQHANSAKTWAKLAATQLAPLSLLQPARPLARPPPNNHRRTTVGAFLGLNFSLPLSVCAVH